MEQNDLLISALEDGSADVDVEVEAVAYALADSNDDSDEGDNLDSGLNSRQLAATDDTDAANPVQMYLCEIGRTPLITADQELRICASVNALPLARKLQSVALADSLPAWQVVYSYLETAWLAALVECGKRLLAQSRWTAHVELEQLCQRLDRVAVQHLFAKLIDCDDCQRHWQLDLVFAGGVWVCTLAGTWQQCVVPHVACHAHDPA